MAILETKVRDENVSKVCQSIWDGLDYCTNNGYGMVGQVWISWNISSVKVNVTYMNKQFINYDVWLAREYTNIGLTIAYGNNNPLKRKVLQHDIIKLTNSMHSTPW